MSSDDGDAGDVLRVIGERARGRGHLVTTHALELALGLAKPRDELGDPLGQLRPGALTISESSATSARSVAR